MTPADSSTPQMATAVPSVQAMGDATQRLEHSRERIRRYMMRTAAGDPKRQNAVRSKRQMWVGVALAVALVLAWQQPWRRASGLARAAALLVAGLKMPGLLSMLASRMEVLMAWWHTFARSPSETDDVAGGAQAEESERHDSSLQTHFEPPAQSQRKHSSETDARA